MLNVSQMLDLPKEQRSIFLRALPLTREYVFGCLEHWDIRHIRRVITRNGGVYREIYCTPGLAVSATFRTYAGMMQATRDLVHWLNARLRKSWSEGLLSCSEGHLTELLYDEEFAHRGAVPALTFEIVNAIDYSLPLTSHRPAHPVRG